MDEEEITEGHLLRLVPCKEDFLPKGATFPTWKALQPSDEDKATRPVRVSFYDLSRTTLDSALALRNSVHQLSPRVLGVLDMHAVANDQANPNPHCRAVLDDPETGHVGVEGLYHDSFADRGSAKAAKRAWKAFLIDLSKCLRMHEP